MPKINLFKKLSLIFLSSVLFLNSMTMPFAVAKAAPTAPKDNNTLNNSSSSSSSSSDSAPSTWYNQDFKSWLEKVDDDSNPSEIFGERYTSAQVQWIIYSLLSFLMHTTLPSDVVSCVFSNTVDLSACKDAIQKFLTPEAPPSVVLIQPQQNKSLLSLIFATNRPISGIGYVYNKITNFGIVPETYAQSAGFGFDALKPVQEMWKASRDVAFGLFVLMAIIFAFMIMFRVKISPQLVISVQSAIPKIVAALVLATFSYAIAGFAIDLMYVIIGILSIIISTFIPSFLGTQVDTTIIFNMLTLGQPTGFPIQIGIFWLMFMYLTPLVITLLILTLIIGAASAGVLFWIPLILLIIVIVVGLWITIKTTFALLKAFVNILLLTIFAPIQFTLGVLIPSLSFNSWLRNYIANLSVFVVTGALYWFSVIFLLQAMHIGLQDLSLDLAGIVSGNLFRMVGGAISISTSIANSNPSWPPLLGASGNYGTGFLFLGVSFVLFTLIPKATEIVQGFISGKPFAYGSAIGESITQPFTGALRAMTAAQQIGTSYSTRFGTRKVGESQEKPTNLNDNRQPVAGTTPME